MAVGIIKRGESLVHGEVQGPLRYLGYIKEQNKP